MKTLVIIVSVLSVAMIVYGEVNTDRLKRFYGYIDLCSKKYSATPSALTPEALLCATEMDGELTALNGEYKRSAVLEAIGEAISDLGKLQEAQEIYRKCHDKAYQSGLTGHELALKIAECSLPVIYLFDKL